MLMGSSVFREEYKLLPDYLPGKIPHRERELEQLRRTYSSVLSPVPTPATSFLLGPVGTGKTMLARKLCGRLEEDGRRDGFIVKAVTVNCRIDRGPSSVLNRLVESLGLSFPKRGYEVQETLRFLMDELLQMKARLILVLDEVDSLVSTSGAAFLYALARINETVSSPVLSLLMISKDLRFFWEVDASTRSSLQKAVVKLSPYSADQLLSIVLSRSEEALNPGVLDEDTARLIAGAAADSGGCPICHRAALQGREDGRLQRRGEGEGRRCAGGKEQPPAAGEPRRTELPEPARAPPPVGGGATAEARRQGFRFDRGAGGGIRLHMLLHGAEAPPPHDGVDVDTEPEGSGVLRGVPVGEGEEGEDHPHRPQYLTTGSDQDVLGGGVSRMDALKLEEVLGTAGRVKVLLLLIDQEEMNISQIVRLSGLQHSSVQKHPGFLCEQHLVREKRYGRIRIFALEEKNPYVALLKRFFADWNRMAASQGVGYA